MYATSDPARPVVRSTHRPLNAAMRVAAAIQLPITLAALVQAPVQALQPAALLAVTGLVLGGAWLLWSGYRTRTRLAAPRSGARALPAVIERALQGLAEPAPRDALTGTLTREGLSAALVAAGPVPGVVAVIDVNGLGAINRREGVERGDTLMREVAAQLMNGLRPGDLLARWGGDEFAVCLAGVTRRDSEQVLRRLEETLLAMPVSAGREGGIGVTIGVAKFAGLPGPALANAVREAEEEIHTIRQLRRCRVA